MKNYKGSTRYMIFKDEVESRLGYSLSEEEFDLFGRWLDENLNAQLESTLDFQIDFWETMRFEEPPAKISSKVI